MHHKELKDMDLISVRNLFLEETKKYFAAIDTETPDQLKQRRDRIKEIEATLDRKKEAIHPKEPDPFRANSSRLEK